MFLNNPVSIGDLLAKGTHFEINSDFDHVPEDEFSELFMHDPEDEENLPKQIIESPWEKSFAELIPTMEKGEHGIYKKITKEGTDPIPEGNVRAIIHYNAFFEGEIETFDSTYLRAKPKAFIIGQYEVLPGIELAVKSMKNGEEAQFIVPYEELFGEMGCPPRVKPKADGLFIITLLNFAVLGDDQALDKLSNEQKNKYPVVVERVKETRLSAIDHFKQGRIKYACRAFHKAVNALEMCQIQNDSEQNEQQQMIISLYTNLAVCYNKLGLPAKTCSMCNEIARISNINKNCKALFQEGRAYFKLGEFERAKRKLRQALHLEPNNHEIKKELHDLAKKYEKFDKQEKDLWTKAFGMIAGKSPEDEELGQEFKGTVDKMIKCFVNEEQQSFRLPDGASELELEYIRSVAEKNNMKLNTAAKLEGIEYILNKVTK